eukprot:1965996-Rhodomonas_salina.1
MTQERQRDDKNMRQQHLPGRAIERCFKRSMPCSFCGGNCTSPGRRQSRKERQCGNKFGVTTTPG